MSHKKRHFLVVASASRGARLFIKKALLEGHDVTGMCRAENDLASLNRMNAILQDTELTPSAEPDQSSTQEGKLYASSLNILESNSYSRLLESNNEIDSIVCFVGTTKLGDMLSKRNALYSDTIQAIVDGMKQSRSVEVLYHSSVGSEGKPGASISKWPANYPFGSTLVHRIFHIFKDVTLSENILANKIPSGSGFIVFRPAALTNGPAKRHYGYSFDTTGLHKADFPLAQAKISISREDTAEEILRVATLDISERKKWYGHGIYLADKK